MSNGKKSVPEWRDHFVATARRIFPGRELSFEEAVSAVRQATGLQLLAFDEWVRRGHRYHLTPGGGDAQGVMRIALEDPELADAYLFYEACNGNGRVRERALRALRGRDQRLIFAAILIRTEDWVPEIARVAAVLLKDTTATPALRHAFEFLDLIDALRSRHRFVPQWIETLEPALLLLKWRDERRAALSRGNSPTRHNVRRSCGKECAAGSPPCAGKLCAGIAAKRTATFERCWKVRYSTMQVRYGPWPPISSTRCSGNPRSRAGARHSTGETGAKQ